MSLAGLGLRVGAGLLLAGLFATRVAAQQPVPRPPRDTTTRDTLRLRGDTVVAPIPQRADSSIVGDTSAARRPGADSVRAPLARFEAPVSTDVGFRYEWDREAFFASGALTLLDLLDRVPGATGLRAGWLAAPMTASYLGAPGRVRVFMDGIEVDALLGREAGTLDLAAIQLWQLEDVAVERGADELRVWIRSWRQERTTPQTRVDIATGDEETNLYRAFFGKRYDNGMALQVGAQQWSTSASPRSGGSGDALSLLTRVGWARGRWSLDALVQQNRRSGDGLEDGTRGGTGEPVLPGLETRDRNAYLRAGWGRPEGSGLWVQAIASTRRLSEAGQVIDSARSVAGGLARDTRDTITSRAQYLLAAGASRGAVRLSGTVRARPVAGGTWLSPLVRLSIDRRWVTATLLAERQGAPGDTSATRVELLGRLSPLPFLSLAGAVSRRRIPPGDGSIAGQVRDDAMKARMAGAGRVELALRAGRTWLSAGVMQRDRSGFRAIQLFNAERVSGPEAPVAIEARDPRGTFVAARGPLWRAFGVDAYGVRWNDEAGLNRPRWQSRGELYVRTNWLRRFPSGEFGLLVAGIHEYRSDAPLLVSRQDTIVMRTAPQSRTLGTLVELRLQQAVISWQYRNILGERYATVPGFAAVRPVNFYGVRWEFSN